MLTTFRAVSENLLLASSRERETEVHWQLSKSQRYCRNLGSRHKIEAPVPLGALRWERGIDIHDNKLSYCFVVCSQVDLATNSHQKESTTYHETKDDVPVCVEGERCAEHCQEMVWCGDSEPLTWWCPGTSRPQYFAGVGYFNANFVYTGTFLTPREEMESRRYKNRTNC